MEKQLRSVVCPDHNLRYDPTQTDGCVRCMRLLGTTGTGRTPYPAAAPAAKADASSGSKLVPAIAFAAALFAGFLLVRTVRVEAPEGAFVDPDGRFAVVVPPRWKIVDPAAVTYLRNFMRDEPSAVTLISDKGRLAPTVLIDVLDKSPGPVSRGDIGKFEEGIRKGWGEEGKIDVQVDMASVDRVRSFRASMLGEKDRQKVSVETYFVPGRRHSYTINALMLGDRASDTAAAARQVADGFRVLERPLPLGRLPLRIVLGLLMAVLIASAGALAKK